MPLFPTDPSQTVPTSASGDRVAFPKSWAFDPAIGDVATDSTGKVQVANGLDAYRDWALRTVQTQRYRHPIYSRQYGTELDTLRRQNLASGVLESEITRTVTEALSVDPRTKRVGDFSFERSGPVLTVSFSVTTAQDVSLTMTVPIGGDGS